MIELSTFVFTELSTFITFVFTELSLLTFVFTELSTFTTFVYLLKWLFAQSHLCWKVKRTFKLN